MKNVVFNIMMATISISGIISACVMAVHDISPFKWGWFLFVGFLASTTLQYEETK